MVQKYASGVIYDAIYARNLVHFGSVNYKHNPEYCKAFGIHLRKMREAKGFGMREFASHADIEYSQLSKIERGVTNPTISTVFAIAEALDVSHGLLYDFKFPVSKNKNESNNGT